MVIPYSMLTWKIISVFTDIIQCINTVYLHCCLQFNNKISKGYCNETPKNGDIQLSHWKSMVRPLT